MQEKRGALDLSMNTIVVIVIGITLLTLGLKWIYGIFGDIEKSRGQISSAMDEQIRELFGQSNEPINLLTTSKTIKQGENFDLGVGIKNTLPERHPFVYTITIDQAPSNVNKNTVKSWFTSGEGTTYDLASGQLQAELISLDIPKQNAPLGTYRAIIMLRCTDTCGLTDSIPFVFRVQ
ncbi:MAG: hypothetical protein Q7R96_03990 [Nanoarchaeota archaeon]|nr:hypothetical protein [Nanoarchaeota archaeon]